MPSNGRKDDVQNDAELPLSRKAYVCIQGPLAYLTFMGTIGIPVFGILDRVAVTFVDVLV